MPVHAFSPLACYKVVCNRKGKQINTITYCTVMENILYAAVSMIIYYQLLCTFPCREVMVQITFTPQFCASVLGIASTAMAAASYGHCYQQQRVLSVI
jgi:hypothetical protein